MTSYRRDGKSSRAHAKKNRRNRSGQTRGYHQDQGQVNSHSGHPGNPYASGHHGGVPPSPASSAPAAAPGMRLGAAHNQSENPNACQPGTFRIENWQHDGSTAHPTRPSTALSGTPPSISQDVRVPVASLSNNASTNCLCYEPTGSYAVCRIFSRCSTGEGNRCRQRGSPQPGYNFDEGNTRLMRRSPRAWSEFGEGNPRTVPLSRGINSVTGVRAQTPPPQPWQGSLRFTRRSPQSRVAHQ